MGDYLRKRKLVTWMMIVALAVLAAVAVIYVHPFPMIYALYAAGIGLALDFLGLLLSGLVHSRKVDKLQERLEEQDPEHPEDALWDAGDQMTEAYYQAFKRLGTDRRRLVAEQNRQRAAERKYLSQWTRRVRSSISAIRLTLKNIGTPPAALMEDLQSLEHYVDMVSYHSRMNAQDGDFFIKETDPDPIIRRVAEKFALQAARRKLKLKISPSPGKVNTDEKCLQFILEQLVSNALKFTNIGEITIYFEEPGVLCVRDTGIGMKPEELEEILEDPAPKGRKGSGSRGGIGLTTCIRLAEQLGQTLTVLSTPGSGTLVKLAMEPVIPPEENAGEPEEDVRVSRRGRKKRKWRRKSAPAAPAKETAAPAAAAVASAMAEIPEKETSADTIQIPKITEETAAAEAPEPAAPAEEAEAPAAPEEKETPEPAEEAAPQGPADPEEAVENTAETREAWEEAADN
ncbi:MAG: HAMP domain-containing histidine kinase, partial [Firmicutes bacterium]|nr:HAMP domain-containing histidine kinase [Bacillota bacterium]